MNKEFVPYEQALTLKELGFDEPCFKVYDTMGYIQDQQTMINLGLDWYSAPLYQQAFNWLRKKYDIDHIIYPHVECFKRSYLANIYIGLEQKNMKNENMVSIRFYTYEEAELACLKKLIEIVKKK
jgi:hypothetical protein